MGLIKAAITGTTGMAIGLALGYSMFKADDQSCREAYATELQRFEEKYKGIEPTQGVATPRDFSLDYVVSIDGKFKGTVLNDKVTGESCVLTKTPFFSQNIYNFVCGDPLKDIVSDSTGSFSVEPQLRGYAISTPSPIEKMP